MLTTPKVKFKVDLYLQREIYQIVDIHAFLINGRIFNKFYVLVSSGDNWWAQRDTDPIHKELIVQRGKEDNTHTAIFLPKNSSFARDACSKEVNSILGVAQTKNMALCKESRKAFLRMW